MKTQSSRRGSGFTLVELLVVIAIVAVLASASFAGLNAAMNKARRVKAQAVVTSLESAINNFYGEYGSLPELSGKTEVDTSKDSELITILMGMETEEPYQNNKKLKMLSLKEGKGNKDGVIFSTDKNSVTGLYDPWGNGYTIHLDTLYEEKLKFDPSATGEVTLNGRRVAVFSPGVPKGEDVTPSTLVKTW